MSGFMFQRSAGGASPRYAVAPALAASLWILAACAGRQALSDDPFSSTLEGKGQIQIEVTNLNFSDATLWAHRGSMRVRLGVVTGKADGVFNLEWRTIDPLRLEVDLLALGRCVTREMIADPGDVILLQIDQNFLRSEICERTGIR